MTAQDARQYAPATERNREPILEVLLQVLPERGTILEILVVLVNTQSFLRPGSGIVCGYQQMSIHNYERVLLHGLNTMNVITFMHRNILMSENQFGQWKMVHLIGSLESQLSPSSTSI